jgi:hypothetical protein
MYTEETYLKSSIYRSERYSKNIEELINNIDNIENN